ncbi:hypothetical protein PMIN07_005962 [Paraphaeosphaeria minitans]
MSAPETKPGFLSVGINALSPWGSRSGTPKPPATPHTPKKPGEDKDKDKPKHGDKDKEKDTEKEKENAAADGAGPQRGGDHTVNRRHRLGLNRYPDDCPPLAVRWYHSVDVPKRKPFASSALVPEKQPVPRPRKWIPFSFDDSRSIENAFQKTAAEADAAETRRGILSPSGPASGLGKEPETSTTVPVNEDYLFDVEIETRELSPVYWLGPVYDVKRGTWFTPDGEPCDENLATQLEEGYLKVKPWRLTKPAEKRSESQPRTRPISLNMKVDDDYRKELGRLNHRDSTSNPVTPKASFDNLKAEAGTDSAQSKTSTNSATPPDESSRTYRLFGSHMNSVVTYQDDVTAYILTDDMWSRMGSTLYQRFAGAAHFAGQKYVRGYVDSAKKKEEKPSKEGANKKATERPVTPSLAYGSDHERQRAASGSETVSDMESEGEELGREASPGETRRKNLERQISSLIISTQTDSSERQEEAVRKREEEEMREDYKDHNKGEQGREIEHLLLVTHGIGQRLGIRMESVNFVHDVNSLRKSLKAVYSNSPDLQALNSDVDKEAKNSRVQVLPICWRHLLDFPQQSLKHNRKEHDLGDLDVDDHEYPNLEDITVEGVPAVRNLLTDLALDILLYQSPAYKGHITRIVVKELNRIYRLFKERNPSFNGKISLVGHSLGSAIMFDILCQQKDARSKPSMSSKARRATEEGKKLDFEVEDFYALGSPIGLFQMLKGRTIAARPSASYVTPETPASPLDDPFSASSNHNRVNDFIISSPLCKQLFNIFHPTDPISYRLEPLISPAMSSLKAQPLPYTKRGLFGGPSAQGLTNIGQSLGQGVTNFWTSVSTGIASGLLNRSLGITGSDASKMSNDLHGQRTSRPLSVGQSAGNLGNNASNVEDPARALMLEERKRRLGEEPIAPGDDGEHPPTLIDSEIETLYAGFQKRRKSREEDTNESIEKDLEWQELEERSRKLRKEEGKVRALNANGRVDYSIQEGVSIAVPDCLAPHHSSVYYADSSRPSTFRCSLALLAIFLTGLMKTSPIS